eukprot:gb/GEZN01019666.1/.p1 GENE.gb/GEZN01019666.1/~~gb/GEZN01019666.1/.p1  ORF type:complete len:153 (+),score=10.20 gb/GEZN01019666.1/:3-461(+)
MKHEVVENPLNQPLLNHCEYTQQPGKEMDVERATPPQPELMEDYEGTRTPLRGGGKGASSLDLTTGIPCQEDDNCCRMRLCCADGGCLKFRVACQLLCCRCDKGWNGPKLDTEFNFPLFSDPNFCRIMCCFFDFGLRKLDCACQLLCCKFVV